jgi:protein-histidine pros-kinase
MCLVLREGRVREYSLTARAKDGSDTVVSYNATTLHDREGNLRGVFAAARDVTDRKRAEEQFRGLLESAPDAMIICDGQGKIVLVNSQTERLFGYGREELLGQPLEVLVPRPLRDEHAEDVTAYSVDPRVWPVDASLDLHGRRKDGSEFPAEVNLSPLATQGGNLVSSAIRDITYRKRIEQRLHEKTTELQAALQAKDRFLASMSHELRTPLNAILGFTGTLLMRLPGPLNAGQERQLKTVQMSSRHLLALINDLLDLAKIESGKVEITPERVVCQEVLEEVAASLRPLAEAKGLSFAIAAPQEDIILQTDRRTLTQILLNLANNAIKFTDTGRVELALVQRDDNAHKGVEFRVEDTGVGIRPEDQARLFKAFERLITPGARRQEGTGLGLHVSQKLANLLDSRIEFTSTFGKGSTFTLLLKE